MAGKFSCQFDSQLRNRTADKKAKENAARAGNADGIGIGNFEVASSADIATNWRCSTTPAIKSFTEIERELCAMRAPAGLTVARARFLSLASESEALQAVIAYFRSNAIDTDELPAHLGAVSILPIVETESGRFAFSDGPDGFMAFVAEAFDQDGEHVADLVAWPVGRPEHILTAFGVLPLLGMWNALNKASYFNDRPCPVHRSGLDWMRSGFRGVAIAVPALAGPLLAAMTHIGTVAAADLSHGHWIKRLAGRHAVPLRILVPVDQNGRAA